MILLGFLGLLIAVVCTWVFIGTTARADHLAGGQSRMTRPSRLWLLAAVVSYASGMLLIGAGVVRLWL